MDALAGNTEITSNFPEVFVGWLLHKGAFVSPEMEQDKGYKGHHDI